MGGQTAEALKGCGYRTCGQVAALLRRDPAALRALGVAPAKAALLAQYVRGEDPSLVQDKGPQGSSRVSVQDKGL